LIEIACEYMDQYGLQQRLPFLFSYQVFFSFKISYQYLKNTTQSYVCWSVPCLNIEYTYIQSGGIRYLMPLSTIFQLYRGSQFYWGRKPEYIEKTTDLSQVTLSYNVVSSTPRLSKIWTHVNGDPMYKETFLVYNQVNDTGSWEHLVVFSTRLPLPESAYLSEIVIRVPVIVVIFVLHQKCFFVHRITINMSSNLT
jgi:hypothetical protein